MLRANNGNDQLCRRQEGHFNGKFTLPPPNNHLSTFAEVQSLNREYSGLYVGKVRPIAMYNPGSHSLADIRTRS